MTSVFDGIVRSYTLTKAGTTAGTDQFGNPIPGTATVSFRAALTSQAVRGGRSLVDLYGGDGVDDILLGEMLEPVTLPAGVGAGWECPLTWGNQPGTLRIVAVLQDPLQIVEAVTGQAFYAQWRRT